MYDMLIEICDYFIIVLMYNFQYIIMVATTPINMTHYKKLTLENNELRMILQSNEIYCIHVFLFPT